MTLKFLVKLAITIILIISNVVSAHATCNGKSALEIGMIFTKAIRLNENFKLYVRAVESDDAKYHALRRKNEQYGEFVLMPCVNYAAKLLSHRPNQLLMHKLMELAISYENSADETIPYSMGKIFASNPAAIENEMSKFSIQQRGIILENVKIGWEGAKVGLNASLIKDRQLRLEKLEKSLGNRPFS